MADQPPASSENIGVALQTSLRGASPASAGDAPSSVVEGAPAQAPSTTEPLPFGVPSDAPPKRTGGGSVVECSTRSDDGKEDAIRGTQRKAA